MKNLRNIKGPRKVNTHAIIGKIIIIIYKAPDSQTSQSTCRAKEIEIVHRSHSAREAKQNQTNMKNQGSPIKTIKSHDSVLLPLLCRGVFTAGLAPAMPFPTHTYKCVGGSRSRKSRSVARRRLASSSSLCREVIKIFRSLQHPLVPRRPIVHLRCEGPYGSVNSACKPAVHRRAVRSSECLEVVLETIQPVLYLLQSQYNYSITISEISMYCTVLLRFTRTAYY